MTQVCVTDIDGEACQFTQSMSTQPVRQSTCSNL